RRRRGRRGTPPLAVVVPQGVRARMPRFTAWTSYLASPLLRGILALMLAVVVVSGWPGSLDALVHRVQSWPGCLLLRGVLPASSQRIQVDYFTPRPPAFGFPSWPGVRLLASGLPGQSPADRPAPPSLSRRPARPAGGRAGEADPAPGGLLSREDEPGC